LTNIEGTFGSSPDDYIPFPLKAQLWLRYSAKTVCPVHLTPGYLLHSQLSAHSNYLQHPPLGGEAPMEGVDDVTDEEQNHSAGCGLWLPPPAHRPHHDCLVGQGCGYCCAGLLEGQGPLPPYHQVESAAHYPSPSLHLRRAVGAQTLCVWGWEGGWGWPEPPWQCPPSSHLRPASQRGQCAVS